jgi:hypothetical protein
MHAPLLHEGQSEQESYRPSLGFAADPIARNLPDRGAGYYLKMLSSLRMPTRIAAPATAMSQRPTFPPPPSPI